jgi:hypothetical protein
MTVLDNTPRDQYTATGGQVAFSYTFEIAAEGDIAVLQNGVLLSLGTGAGEYAVTGVGSDTGGVVTLVTGATSGDIITLYRDMALERLTSYTNGGDFLAADVNNDYDRLWLALQQNTGTSNRALVAPNTDPTNINMTIPDKATRLNKFLKFNSITGNPEVSSISGEFAASGMNVYNFTGDGTTVSFTLGTGPGGENNTQVYIDGVYQQKDGYNVSGSIVQFSVAPPNLSTIEVMVIDALPVGATTASQVSFTQAGSTTARNVQLKLQETVSVKDFGAVGDGVTDDTAAFNNCRTATSGRYLIPSGSYVLDASPNVWEDTFTAPNGSTQLIIGGTTYDISGSFGSGWSTRIPATQRYLYWLHARTGKTIAIWSDGELSGDSNRFFLPFDVRRDSHFFIAAPETDGGSTDLLFRRSEANPDPTGNRFAINFEEASDRYNLTYATTASGSPSFDSAYQVIAGLTPSLIFPALSLDMKQGYTIQTRAGGALRIQNYPDSDTTQVIRDATSGNVLQKINKSRQAIAGVGFDTLLDTPQGVTQPRMWGGVFSDTGSEADGTLPVTKNIWDTAGATNNQVIGTLMVAAATSGGNLYYRESRFVFDGTTVTITDLVNTLPVQIVSTIALSGTSLQFQASYAGGLGTGCTVTAMINWCGAGR